jgi:WD40 repeat protein/tetratricopeptide (TPR) repeat protein
VKTIFLYSLVLLIPAIALAAPAEFSVTEIQSLESFSDYVREVRFSPFGGFFAVTVGDNSVYLYNRAFNRLWTSQGNRKNVGGKLSFSPDEKYLAFSRYKSQGDIGILDLKSLQVIQALDGHPYWVTGIAYSPDGRYLVSCGVEKQVIVWKWQDHAFHKHQVLKEHEKPVRDIAYSSSTSIFASAGDDANIIIWKLQNGSFEKHQVLSNNKYYITSIAFSRDGRFLASGSTNLLTIWKFDGERFVEEQRLEHSSGGMWSVEFSPDNDFVAAAISNGTVRVWGRGNGKTWKEIHNIYRHNDNVFDASFRSDGRLFATASSDQSAVFWRLEGVGPDPVISLMNALALPFSQAQKRVVNNESSRIIMSGIDDGLTAPKDEFETSDEYESRMGILSSHVLFELQKMTERYFGATERKAGEISVPVESLDSYDADNQTYSIKVFGTEARLHIPPSEARNLKRNSEHAAVLVSREKAPDGVSFLYSNFRLAHPTNNKSYELSMAENPFRSSSQQNLTDKPMDELSTALSKGPSVLIEGMEFDAVYPVFYKYYDENPIGRAVLRNSGSKSVENVQVSLFIKQYMDNPKICKAPSVLVRGQREEVLLYGLFTNRVLEISEGNKVSVKIIVDYTAENKAYTQEFVGTIRIHNRNAMTWDDDLKVASFVTAKDTAVLKFSKNVAGMIKDKASRSLNANLLMGIALYEALSLYGMSYVIDPTTPHRELSQNRLAVDFIQFPKQTLEYRAGDCDDLSILYNALLESVGVDTAFITIPGHIFTAFSLDMSEDEARKHFENSADLIFKDGVAWIPVENTILDDGFLKAWLVGSRQWRENSKHNKAGLFKTVDAWRTYEPVGLFGGTTLTLPESSLVVQEYIAEVKRLISREISSKEKKLLSEIDKRGASSSAMNRLGVLYARYGLEEKAISTFEGIIRDEEYTPSLMNLGNVYYLQSRYDMALKLYERAHRREPDNPKVLLGLTRVYQKLGEQDKADAAFTRLSSIDSSLAERNSYLGQPSTGGSRAHYAEADQAILWEE